MDFNSRPLAITDFEMTGLDSQRHEIIEIGLVLVNQKALKIKKILDLKVEPQNLKTADPEALKVAGYNKKDWAKAVSVDTAIQKYLEIAKDGILCSWNVANEWNFLEAALRKTKLNRTLDYHSLDLFTFSWMKLKNSELKDFGLRHVCKHLGIKPEPKPHRAINGAMKAYEIFKKLMEA